MRGFWAAVPNQCIPHWKNRGFFEAAGFIQEALEGEVSIGFMDVPGTKFTIELMCYHNPKGRMDPVFFKANDISGRPSCGVEGYKYRGSI